MEKAFWPNEWDEFRVLDEIKYVLENNPYNTPGTNWLDGFTSTGQKIRMYINESDGTIISAFPILK